MRSAIRRFRRSVKIFLIILRLCLSRSYLGRYFAEDTEIWNSFCSNKMSSPRDGYQQMKQNVHLLIAGQLKS